MIFTKRDFVFSIITGVTTGFIAWKVFDFTGVPLLNGYSYAWLIVIVPVLWVLGINFGYLLSRWYLFFAQFGKFSAIGFTNAAVDFGVLNLLIAYTGLAAGVYFAIFKATSFMVATIHSYFWNKYWAFEAVESGPKKEEALKFFSVAVVAIIINVGAASFVVNSISPILGFNLEQWANVGAVVGAAAALIVSFTGFKFLVFRK